MKTFNKEEYNRLCAEFLGWEKHHTLEDFYSIPQHLKISKLPSFRRVEKMVFDSDWNWIMEVVEKIESLNYENSIILQECSIIDTKAAEAEPNPFDIRPIAFGEEKTKKEAVVQAIWQFLNWHYDNTRNQKL